MAGASLHETDEIVADLSRIGSKMKTEADKQKIESLKKLVSDDREVLIKGPVPATAVKGSAAMGATRLLQGVQVVGFTLSAVEPAGASMKSPCGPSAPKPCGRPEAGPGPGRASSWVPPRGR